MEKVVLVTGASGGIGKAISKLLAEKGCRVYGTTTDKSKDVGLKALGVEVIELDVTNENSMVVCVNHVLDIEGRIDVLVNNAGFGQYGALEDVPISKARTQMEVNVFGVARMIQLVLPKMRIKRSGTIINLSSGGGRFSTPYGSWYHASKYAIEGLSDALRNEVKQFGIDVVIIEPGSVRSEFAGIGIGSLEKSAKGSAYQNTIKRVAEAYRKMGKNDSDPIVIAKLVAEAIDARKPKTRYAGAAGIKPALFMKWLLPDRIFDKFIQSSFKF